MAESTLNSQIIDSVAAVNFLNHGSSQASSQAMLNAVMAEAIGMAMHNAVMRQQSGSMISSAATTAACARMLQARSGGGAPQTPSAPSTPPASGPTIPPLDGPPTGSVAVTISEEKAGSAIRALGNQANDGKATSDKANAALSGLSSAILGLMGKSPTPAPSGAATPSAPQGDAKDPSHPPS